MPNITIYTTSSCPYCIAAKALLRKKGAPFHEIDVNTAPGIRAGMREKAGGINTVPQIWIGETHVGGCDVLHVLDRAGNLDPMLTS